MDRIDEALTELELALALLIAWMWHAVRTWGITLAVLVEIHTMTEAGQHAAKERATRAQRRAYGFVTAQHRGLVTSATDLTARLRFEREAREAQLVNHLQAAMVSRRARMAGAF